MIRLSITSIQVEKNVSRKLGTLKDKSHRTKGEVVEGLLNGEITVEKVSSPGQERAVKGVQDDNGKSSY